MAERVLEAGLGRLARLPPQAGPAGQAGSVVGQARAAGHPPAARRPRPQATPRAAQSPRRAAARSSSSPGTRLAHIATENSVAGGWQAIRAANPHRCARPAQDLGRRADPPALTGSYLFTSVTGCTYGTLSRGELQVTEGRQVALDVRGEFGDGVLAVGQLGPGRITSIFGNGLGHDLSEVCRRVPHRACLVDYCA